jgi:hypothetical protein
MKALKEYIKEGILDTTRSGRAEYIKNKVMELIPGIKYQEDFIYDERADAVSIWSVPKGCSIKMSEWDEGIRVYSFEVYDPFDIYIKGDKELAKFKKCFDCSLGYYNSNKKENEVFDINISNCKFNGIEFTHRYYCRFIFNNCEVNLQDGPNALYIKVHSSCKEITKPWGHDILRKMEIQK